MRRLSRYSLRYPVRSIPARLPSSLPESGFSCSLSSCFATNRRSRPSRACSSASASGWSFTSQLIRLDSALIQGISKADVLFGRCFAAFGNDAVQLELFGYFADFLHSLVFIDRHQHRFHPVVADDGDFVALVAGNTGKDAAEVAHDLAG